jgi:hypothetical protein
VSGSEGVGMVEFVVQLVALFASTGVADDSCKEERLKAI